MAEKKTRRGRPRMYRRGTETVTLRVPMGMKAILQGVLAGIAVASNDMDTHGSLIILDALKRRLRQLENREPELVKDVLAKCERWEDTNLL